MNNVINRVATALHFRLLRFFSMQNFANRDNIVYLTFDDGPETGITEFVLSELDKFNFKATFFCRGDNAERNRSLVTALRDKGHSVGNHTYSHLHSFDVTTDAYVNDIERAGTVLHTRLFRPPHGILRIKTYFKIFRKYRIVYWTINSEDSMLEAFDLEHAISKMKKNTKSGDIILFHFCHKHEKETVQLLPLYLSWLSKQGYQSKAIEE